MSFISDLAKLEGHRLEHKLLSWTEPKLQYLIISNLVSSLARVVLTVGKTVAGEYNLLGKKLGH